MSVSGPSSGEETGLPFTTREVTPKVMLPGLIAFFGFLILLRYVLASGQLSTVSLALIFYGTLAFPMLLHPLYTTVRVSEDRIDWKIFGRFGTVIYLDELRELRVHHRLFIKLDTGRHFKPTICPVDQEGFLKAIRRANPDLTITGGSPYPKIEIQLV